MVSERFYGDKYCDVMEVLMGLPFNASQSGFKMIADSVVKVLDLNSDSFCLTTSVYKDVASEYGVSIKLLEKNMRDAMVTASNNCHFCDDIAYPNLMIEVAIKETKTKNFISAVSTYVKFLRGRRLSNS